MLLGPIVTQLLIALVYIIISYAFGEPSVFYSSVPSNGVYTGIVLIQNPGESLYSTSLTIDAEDLKIIQSTQNYASSLNRLPESGFFRLDVLDLPPHSSATILVQSTKAIRDVRQIKSNLSSKFRDVSKHVSTEYPIAALSALLINLLFLAYFNISSDRYAKSVGEKIEDQKKRLAEDKVQFEESKEKIKALNEEVVRAKAGVARFIAYYRRISSAQSKEIDFWRRVFERSLSNEGVARVNSRQLLSVIASAIGVKTQDDSKRDVAEDIKSIDRLIEIIVDDKKANELAELGRFSR